jgi:hypothetical protein
MKDEIENIIFLKLKPSLDANIDLLHPGDIYKISIGSTEEQYVKIAGKISEEKIIAITKISKRKYFKILLKEKLKRLKLFFRRFLNKKRHFRK